MWKEFVNWEPGPSARGPQDSIETIIWHIYMYMHVSNDGVKHVLHKGNLSNYELNIPADVRLLSLKKWNLKKK